MTTVIYDGRTLAADSRTTHRHDGCSHDGVTKVFLVEDAVYNKERVLAIAIAGSVWIAQKLARVFVQDPDKFIARVKNGRRLGLTAAHSAALLIITDAASYTFFSGETPKLERLVYSEGKTTLTGIGNGWREAHTLVKLFNFPLDLAVATTGLVSTATGGVVDVLRFEDGKIVEVTTVQHKNFDSLYTEVLQHVRSDQCHVRGVEQVVGLPVLRHKKPTPPPATPAEPDTTPITTIKPKRVRRKTH